MFIPWIGSTAPFTADSNHGLDFRSGMLQSWNKFCFTTGYVEVSVTLPGPDENTQGYVSVLFLFLCGSGLCGMFFTSSFHCKNLITHLWGFFI